MLRIFPLLVVIALVVKGRAACASENHGGIPAARVEPTLLVLAKAREPEFAPISAPPLPERAPAAIRSKAPSGEKHGPDLPTAWDAKAIEAAEADCGRLMVNSTFNYKPLPPIRQGVCGAPSPISLKYVTDQARVEFRPAPTINCRVGGALARWLREVVQPRAWELLDARVIRVVVAGSYDCRERNGGQPGMISQHAFANAVDITAFVTAKGEHINLVAHWDAGDERAKFLRDIHSGACKIFGTVLGPEANEAHRDHFHLDMTPRRHSAYCQ